MTTPLDSTGRHRRTGLASALVVGALLAPSTADAFVVNRTSSGLPVHWAQSSVVLVVDASVEEITPDAIAVLGSAAGSWAGVDGAPTVSVRRATSPSTPRFDGQNVIYFYPEGYAPAGAALAISIVTYDDSTGLILDADIVLNGLYTFAVLAEGARPDLSAIPVSNDGEYAAGELPIPGNPGQDSFDLLHVVAHETGHALGMKDETARTTSLMYLYTLPGNASPRAPTADDRGGIDELYGSSRSGCSSTVAAGPRPVCPWSVAPVLGLLSAAAILRRGRRASRGSQDRTA
jgi:hypothetical protein